MRGRVRLSEPTSMFFLVAGVGILGGCFFRVLYTMLKVVFLKVGFPTSGCGNMRVCKKCVKRGCFSVSSRTSVGEVILDVVNGGCEKVMRGLITRGV
jgi:hypothetical protein